MKNKERKRGFIERKFIKLKYQEFEKKKRKTRNFDLYNQVELDFPDVNNLLK